MHILRGGVFMLYVQNSLAALVYFPCVISRASILPGAIIRKPKRLCCPQALPRLVRNSEVLGKG